MKSPSNPKFKREEKDFIHDLQLRNDTLQQEQRRLKGKLKNASTTVKRLKDEIQTLKRRRNHVNGGGIVAVKRSTASSVRVISRNGNNSSTRGVKSVRSATESPGGCRMSVYGNADVQEDCSGDSQGGAAHEIDEMQERLNESNDEIQRLKKENERLVNALNYSDSAHNDANSRMSSSGTTLDNPSRNHEFGTNDKKAISSLGFETHSQSDLIAQLQEAHSNLRDLEVQYNSLETTSQVQLQIHKKTRLKLEECNAYIKKLKQEASELYSDYEIANQKANHGEQCKDQLEDLLEENRRLEVKLSELCDLTFIRDETAVNADQLEHIRELEKEVDYYKHQSDVLSKDMMAHEANVITLKEENLNLELNCSDLQDHIRQLQDEIDADAQRRMSRKYSATQTDGVTAEICVSNNDSSDEFQTQQMVREDMNKGTDAIKSKVCSGMHQLQCKDRLNQAAKFDKVHAICIQRLQRIRLLEKELDANTKIPGACNLLLSNNGSEDSERCDENILDLKIVGCTLDSSITGADTQTIVIVNLMNFESQVSGIGIGSKPCYELCASYKLKHSRFLMEEIIRRRACFYFYEVDGESISLLGRSIFHLDNLFNAPTCNSEYSLDIKSKNAEKTFGSVLVSTRLKKTLDVTKWLGSDGSASLKIQRDPLPQMNNLEVRVENLNIFDEDLHGIAGEKMIIGYSLLGFQGSFTDIIYGDKNKSNIKSQLERTRTFPIEATPNLIGAISKSNVQLSLRTSLEKYSSNDDLTDTVIGTGLATFDDLDKSQEITKRVQFISQKGFNIGYIDLKIQWLCETILNNEGWKYSNGEEHVLDFFIKDRKVDYLLFLRFIDPPPELNEYLYQLQKHEDHLRKELKSEGNELSGAHFIKIIESLGEQKIKNDEALDIFNYVSTQDGTEINVTSFFHFCFSRQLQSMKAKMFSQKNQAITAQIARNLLRKADTEDTGYVSKSSFFDIIETLGIGLNYS